MARTHRSSHAPPPDREILLSPGRSVLLVERLGRGSNATVYRGVVESPHTIRRAVAVKIFDTIATDGREHVVEAIARSTRLAAYVRHPNVAHTYELASAGAGRPVVVSELVEGKTLTELIDAYTAEERRLPPDLALFIATEIAEACAGARDSRTPEGALIDLCHLDLSTREVMLSWRGEVKVTDFGIGAATRSASAVRSVRALALRAATISPEVARGHKGDARSDVFALGVILREMLVGPRFPPDLDDGEAFRLAREGYLHTAVFEPRLPPAIEAIVRRALDVDASQRFPHTGSLAYELRRACLSMGVGDARIFLQSALAELMVAPSIPPSSPDATVRARRPNGHREAPAAPESSEAITGERSASGRRLRRPDPNDDEL